MKVLETDIKGCWKFEENKIEEITLKDALNIITENDTILWGFNVVSPIHTGYDKIFFLLKEISLLTDCRPRIIAADVSAMLSHDLDLDLTYTRAMYYKHYIEKIWDFPISFSLASDYVFSREYQVPLLTTCARTSEKIIKDTWASFQKEKKLVSSYIYPLIQILDVFYWKPRIVFAESSQAKIYKAIPDIALNLRLNCAPIAFVFMRQPLDLKGKPLTRSTWKDRISIHETYSSLMNKLRLCVSLNVVENNPFLELLEFSILPFREKCSIDMKIPTQDIEITNRKDLHDLVKKGTLVLPEYLQETAGWFERRLQHVNDYYGNHQELVNWIDFERVRRI